MGFNGIERTPSGKYEVATYHGIYVVPKLWDAIKLRYGLNGWV